MERFKHDCCCRRPPCPGDINQTRADRQCILFVLSTCDTGRQTIHFIHCCLLHTEQNRKKMNRLDPSAKIMMVSFVTCRFINILTNLTRLICLWITSSIVFCILYGPIYSTLYSSVNMIRKVQREANEMQCTHNSL